jgi:hypothetical protein
MGLVKLDITRSKSRSEPAAAMQQSSKRMQNVRPTVATKLARYLEVAGIFPAVRLLYKTWDAAEGFEGYLADVEGFMSVIRQL